MLPHCLGVTLLRPLMPIKNEMTIELEITIYY